MDLERSMFARRFLQLQSSAILTEKEKEKEEDLVLPSNEWRGNSKSDGKGDTKEKWPKRCQSVRKVEWAGMLPS